MSAVQPPGTVALMGCGKMGRAMLKGWLADGNGPGRILVHDPHVTEKNAALSGADFFSTQAAFAPVLSEAECIVLAVKPQTIPDALRFLAPHIRADALVLSIAAGVSLKTLKDFLPPGQAVIRAMPNTPAAIGRGVSVCAASETVTEKGTKTASALLRACGNVEWITDETLMDAVTALSGSGPAYVFLVTEILARAGTKAGLPETLARTLARDTVAGSAALAEQSRDMPLETLRRNVTSPGGTTEAALNVLTDGRLQALFDEALLVAAGRSRALDGR